MSDFTTVLNLKEYLEKKIEEHTFALLPSFFLLGSHKTREVHTVTSAGATHDSWVMVLTLDESSQTAAISFRKSLSMKWQGFYQLW